MLSAPLSSRYDAPPFLMRRVVAGRDVVRVQEHGAAEKEVELYLVVARKTGMRSPAPVVLFDEVVDHVRLELALEVLHVVGYADCLAHPARVLHVFHRAAPLAVGRNIVALHRPQAHRDTNDLVALLMQQQRRHGGVHPSAHRDYYPSLAHAMSAKNIGIPPFGSRRQVSR